MLCAYARTQQERFEMRETRPGWRTTEFWLVLAGNILINIGAVDVGGAKYRGLFAILSVVGYSLARGLAKNGVPDGLGEPQPPIGDDDDAGDDIPSEGVALQSPVLNTTHVHGSGFAVTSSGGFQDSAGSIGPEPEGVPKSPEG